MKIKVFEIRDEGTFIAALAVDMNAPEKDQHYLLRRCGYPIDGRPNILLTRLDGSGGRASNDPYYWGDRTWAVAHNHIIDNWEQLRDGDVVDVSFILGETARKKTSEMIEGYHK